MPKPVYLDYNSTTPLAQEVFEAMLPYFIHEFGNSSSRTHLYGQTSQAAVEAARQKIADLLNCQNYEIYFTSGATESDNIALFGVMHEKAKEGKTHLITTDIEHKAVLEPAKQLEKEGIQVTFIKPEASGIINPDHIRNAITPKTGLISVHFVNNEIGTIQPVEEIALIAHEAKILFHTDAAQGIGKCLLNLQNIDLMSFSGHKLYGPKGVGCLYIKKHIPKIKIQPLFFGGGQEKGIRPGTLPTPLIVGLAKALEMTQQLYRCLPAIQIKARDQFLQKLEAENIAFKINGDLNRRISNNLNICFPGKDAEALMLRLRDKIAISSGSACTSDNYQGSYVLKALGLSEYEARCSVRIGFHDRIDIDPKDLRMQP